jgi:hypothetical protein
MPHVYRPTVFQGQGTVLAVELSNEDQITFITCVFLNSFYRPHQSSCAIMPLWSNEEWRARIGSSWCAIGRPFKCHSSTSHHQGNVFGHLLLSISAERMLQCGFLLTMIAIVTGCDHLTGLIKRCKRATKGNNYYGTKWSF